MMNDQIINQENRPAIVINRRRALAGLGVLGLLATTRSSALANQAQATPAPVTPEQAVTMPNWTFSLIEVVDPYAGTVTKPDVIPAGTRVVGCQVMITNDSNQPLEYAVRDIRIRDATGMEYNSGDYLGTEPRIVSQNLPGGERTRGWVWVGIPEDVALDSVVFIPPSPVLRIGLE